MFMSPEDGFSSIKIDEIEKQRETLGSAEIPIRESSFDGERRIHTAKDPNRNRLHAAISEGENGSSQNTKRPPLPSQKSS